MISMNRRSRFRSLVATVSMVSACSGAREEVARRPACNQQVAQSTSTVDAKECGSLVETGRSRRDELATSENEFVSHAAGQAVRLEGAEGTTLLIVSPMVDAGEGATTVSWFVGMRRFRPRMSADSLLAIGFDSVRLASPSGRTGTYPLAIVDSLTAAAYVAIGGSIPKEVLSATRLPTPSGSGRALPTLEDRLRADFQRIVAAEVAYYSVHHKFMLTLAKLPGAPSTPGFYYSLDANYNNDGPAMGVEVVDVATRIGCYDGNGGNVTAHVVGLEPVCGPNFELHPPRVEMWEKRADFAR